MNVPMPIERGSCINSENNLSDLNPETYQFEVNMFDSDSEAFDEYNFEDIEATRVDTDEMDYLDTMYDDTVIGLEGQTFPDGMFLTL